MGISVSLYCGGVQEACSATLVAYMPYNAIQLKSHLWHRWIKFIGMYLRWAEGSRRDASSMSRVAKVWSKSAGHLIYNIYIYIAIACRPEFQNGQWIYCSYTVILIVTIYCNATGVVSQAFLYRPALKKKKFAQLFFSWSVEMPWKRKRVLVHPFHGQEAVWSAAATSDIIWHWAPRSTAATNSSARSWAQLG